ncbi:hypothetical protein C7212DRAFT_340382 [Tuber magnatum]|uniref:Uncharacterized protein n=1 Tax=Tuber magnatum TaxID=42249 RepID=A0A317SWM9_9PEZI|nr:hypothetical protein C7212DRAFT_340382 [Tuber magnatum]
MARNITYNIPIFGHIHPLGYFYSSPRTGFDAPDRADRQKHDDTNRTENCLNHECQTSLRRPPFNTSSEPERECHLLREGPLGTSLASGSNVAWEGGVMKHQGRKADETLLTPIAPKKNYERRPGKKIRESGCGIQLDRKRKREDRDSGENIARKRPKEAVVEGDVLKPVISPGSNSRDRLTKAAGITRRDKVAHGREEMKGKIKHRVIPTGPNLLNAGCRTREPPRVGCSSAKESVSIPDSDIRDSFGALKDLLSPAHPLSNRNRPGRPGSRKLESTVVNEGVSRSAQSWRGSAAGGPRNSTPGLSLVEPKSPAVRRLELGGITQKAESGGFIIQRDLPGGTGSRNDGGYTKEEWSSSPLSTLLRVCSVSPNGARVARDMKSLAPYALEYTSSIPLAGTHQILGYEQIRYGGDHWNVYEFGREMGSEEKVGREAGGIGGETMARAGQALACDITAPSDEAWLDTTSPEYLGTEHLEAGSLRGLLDTDVEVYIREEVEEPLEDMSSWVPCWHSTGSHPEVVGGVQDLTGGFDIPEKTRMVSPQADQTYKEGQNCIYGCGITENDGELYKLSGTADSNPRVFGSRFWRPNLRG